MSEPRGVYPRQFIAVRFKPGDVRLYTYHNDGEPISAGVKVRVETRDGFKTVDVVDVGYESPPYGTKHISGIAPPLGRPV